jgi:phage head maturation protease
MLRFSKVQSYIGTHAIRVTLQRENLLEVTNNSVPAVERGTITNLSSITRLHNVLKENAKNFEFSSQTQYLTLYSN